MKNWEQARKGIENALLHHIAPKMFPLKKVGRPYRHVTPLSAARHYLGAHGVDADRISDQNVAALAMMPHSDFMRMLADVGSLAAATGRLRMRAK